MWTVCLTFVVLSLVLVSSLLWSVRLKNMLGRFSRSVGADNLRVPSSLMMLSLVFLVTVPLLSAISVVRECVSLSISALLRGPMKCTPMIAVLSDRFMVLVVVSGVLKVSSVRFVFRWWILVPLTGNALSAAVMVMLGLALCGQCIVVGFLRWKLASSTSWYLPLLVGVTIITPGT